MRRKNAGFSALLRDRPGVVFLVIVGGFAIGFIALTAIAGGSSDQPDSSVQTIDENFAFSADEQEKDESTQADRSEKPEKQEKSTKSNDLQTAADAAAEAGGATPVGVAIGRLGETSVVTAGSVDQFTIWSTSKVGTIAAYLREFKDWGKVPKATMEASIRDSNNEAVRKFFLAMKDRDGLDAARQKLIETFEAGDGPITDVPTEADPSLQGSIAIGTSKWTVEHGVNFYRAFANGCVTPNAVQPTRDVLSAMNSVGGMGQFGAATVFPADRTFSKGGWSGGSNISQFAIVGRDDDALVIGIATGPTSVENGFSVITKAMKEIKSELKTPSKGEPGSLPRDCA